MYNVMCLYERNEEEKWEKFYQLELIKQGNIIDMVSADKNKTFSVSLF